jgi:hypothetical protein
MAPVSRRSAKKLFDRRLENDPRFLRRIELARNSLQAGRGIEIENLGLEE